MNHVICVKLKWERWYNFSRERKYKYKWLKNKGIKSINTAVGFSFGEHTLKDEMKKVEVLENRLDDLENNRQKVLDQYKNKIETQSKKIDELLSKVN